MFSYPLKAVTTKTLTKINYKLNEAIGVNLFKYQNNSSAIIRLLSCAIDTVSAQLEDLPYKTNFKLNNLEFISIDRINGFYIRSIEGINYLYNNILYGDHLYGYSKYTDKEYELKHVTNMKDFTRHVLPADIFFSGVEVVGDLVFKQLPPYVKTKIELPINNTIITIKLLEGFSRTSIDDGFDNIKIRINGSDIYNNLVEEEIDIIEFVDYYSKYEYSFIEAMIVIGSNATVGINICPYIAGDIFTWSESIIEKDFSDIENKTFVSVDKDNRRLNFSTIINNPVEYPKELDVYKHVLLNIPTNETIWNFYIDAANKLVYVLTSVNKLYCFPLMIPTSYYNAIDSRKTEYQSLKIEYQEDIVNQKYIFTIFPSTKSSDVEVLNILVNGEEFETNVLLDYYKENVDTNNIEIPFSTLFKNETYAYIEFITYGDNISITPIYIDNSHLDPIYTKNLSEIKRFTTTPSIIEDEITVKFTEPTLKSYSLEYEETAVSGSITTTSDSKIVKLSSCANIILDSNKIVNLFDAFYLDLETEYIVTQDTITHIRGTAPYTDSSNITAQAGLAQAGLAEAGIL